MTAVLAVVAAAAFVGCCEAPRTTMSATYPSASPSRAPALHVAADYVAPRGKIHGTAGVLEVPSLGIRAAVAKVGLDGQTMAIPNDPADVGWLDSTATPFDLAGVSLISGHVSDRADHPGALWRLRDAADGADIVWRPAEGGSITFRVTGRATYPRAEGVPADTVARDGRHRLAVVTCADRVENGGRFRYTSNLVVTAVEVARSRP